MLNKFTIAARFFVGAVFVYTAIAKLRQPWLNFAVAIDQLQTDFIAPAGIRQMRIDRKGDRLRKSRGGYTAEGTDKDHLAAIG